MFLSKALGGLLLAVFVLWVQISFFTCAVRRLHDRDKSGWNLLWAILPIVGPLYILFLYILPSDEEENRFGPPTV